MSNLPTTSRQLLSCVTSSGKLQLTIGETAVVAPSDAEVVVRVEASPINPSDLGAAAWYGRRWQRTDRW